jgi:hypothetical protein
MDPTQNTTPTVLALPLFSYRGNVFTELFPSNGFFRLSAIISEYVIFLALCNIFTYHFDIYISVYVKRLCSSVFPFCILSFMLAWVAEVPNAIAYVSMASTSKCLSEEKVLDILND